MQPARGEFELPVNGQERDRDPSRNEEITRFEIRFEEPEIK
jgi:hypothetical protein